MRLLISLIALIGLLPIGGCAWIALGVNNAAHMTVERATTPRITKSFRILDAETGQPVPGACVVAIHNFDWIEDWIMRRTTDAQGIATLRLARDYLHLLEVHVTAYEYISRFWLYFGDAPGPGTGRFSDDPVDIHVYRRPVPVVGLRVPAGFRGTVVYRGGATATTKCAFRFPPDFPAGQRVWWADVAPEGETVIRESAPSLGDSGRNLLPIPVMTQDGQTLPTPDPGADVKGVAAWQIGVTEPEGPWGGRHFILVIGDREAALAKAQEMWQEYGNGERGYIWNGWLRLVWPQAKPSGPGAYAVTRNLPTR